MTFKACDEVLPPQMFLSLPNDGDQATVIFISEPVPREETFRQATRHRYYFAVVTKEGIQAWGVGSRTYRTLRDEWASYLKKCFVVTRHGKTGSTDTKYELSPVKIPAMLAKVVSGLDKKTVDEFLHQIQVFGGESE